jgi:hypothetical protein
MEITEVKTITNWSISPLGHVGEAPVGYAMHFGESTKVLLAVDELVNMQQAINTALEIKDKPLVGEVGPRIVK